MINFTKVKSLRIPNGDVKSITISGVRVWKGGFINLVSSSIDKNGSIYNTTGYMTGARLNSSGEVKTYGGAIHSGFIPYAFGDVIRAKGSTSASVGDSANYVQIYDASFNLIKSFTASSLTVSSDNKYGTYQLQSDGTYLLTIFDIAGWVAANLSTLDTTNVAYLRISMAQCAAADFIVTIDDEIV